MNTRAMFNEVSNEQRGFFKVSLTLALLGSFFATTVAHSNQPAVSLDDSGQEPASTSLLASNSIDNRWRPSKRPDDSDSDGVLDINDNCPSTAAFVTVDSNGCGLFDAVLDKVVFSSGSLWLSESAREQLDSVADTLLAFPESRVQIRAHTDSQGQARYNLALSTRRAEVVAQYLLTRGVNHRQLSTRGMGESEPLYSNEDEAGRLQNRRVDLVTLPDIDGGELPTTESVVATEFAIVADPKSQDPMRDSASGYDDSVASRPVLAAALATEVEPESAGRPIVASTSVPMLDPMPISGIIPGFGMTGVLKNVGFEPGGNELTSRAKDALEPLVKAMERHPSVSIAVMAHSDDKGSSADNLALSIARANAVVEHLHLAGISRDRLVPEGYGEQLPIVQNVTEADREKNRRIDIRVISE